VYAAKGSPTRILLGFTVLVFVLGLCMTTSAQVAVLAPVAMGVVATLGLPAHSNMAKGVFLVLCYVGSLCSNMILSSAVTILAWGIVEQQTGVHIFWSHWLLAFLPLIPLTILAAWWTMRWLYPPETSCPLPDQGSAPAVAHVVGPWSWNERKVLGWLLLAITLWSTDFWHHLNPAAIAMAMGLILTLPGLGVLDVPAIKSVNFFIIVLVGGVLSMAEVLTVTQALAPLTAMLGTWHEALLANAWRGTLALYWGGFLYHFLIGAEFTMVSTMLPVLLDLSTLHGYNPAAMAMLWLFAGGGKLFIYQNTAVVFAYSFGVFQPKDLLKVGAVLTVVEGLFILLLVPLYWPLIGLPWRSTPQAVVAPLPVATSPWQHDLLRPRTAGQWSRLPPVASPWPGGSEGRKFGQVPSGHVTDLHFMDLHRQPKRIAIDEHPDDEVMHLD
jgi:di/tricarboxylate transporter